MGTLILIKDLFSFFSKKRKFQLLLLASLMIIAGLSEALLLATFLNFLNSISNIDVIYESENISNIIKIFKINSPNQLKILFGISFVFILLITAVIRLLNYWTTYRFSSKIGTEISCECFKNKIYQNYTYFLDQDTNNFISLITNYIATTVIVIERFLLIIASLFILIFVLLSLLFINFKITFVIFSLIILIYNFIGRFVVNQLKNNSKLEVSLNREKIFTIRDGINSIREILINHKQEYFLNSFSRSESNYQSIIAQNKYISIFPKTLIEAFGLTIVSIIVLIISISSANDDSFIPVIGTISLASIRLLNSVQTLYSAWSSILSSKTAIKEVIKLLNNKNKLFLNNEDTLVKKAFKFNSVEFIDVSYIYPKSENPTIRNLNFTFKSGDKIGIIGKTGSGKSTFIDLFAGLIFPTSGRIILNGKLKQTEKSIRNWQDNISYLSQSIYISERPLLENIAYGIDKNKIDLDKVKNICKLLLIDEFIDIDNNSFLYKSYGESGSKLSGGQRQRIALARALYKDSKVLILDEATGSLDPNTEKIIMKNLLAYYKKISIIFVSHSSNALIDFDKLYKLDKGYLKEVKSS